MTKLIGRKTIYIAVAIFAGALVFESCASGPKGGKKHCTGKKTARTKAMHRMAPTMAR